MRSNYKSIGELVERVDVRNTDGNIDTLVGLSIEKCFIPSVANTIGTDLTKYKVILKNQFAVSLMQVSRDEKIPVACLKEFDEAIMSPAYSIFQVIDENILLPEYLDMWFKRSEFDREAAFIAVGGVRGSMPWEEFAKMKLPVPHIEKQRSIVKAYQTITDRIALKRKINENLEAAAQAIYKKIFVECIDTANLPEGWRMTALENVAILSAGGDRPAVFSNVRTDNCKVPIYSNGIVDEGFYGFTNKAKIFEESVTVSARGTVGYVFLREEPYVPIVRLISVVPNQELVTAKYLYFALSSIDLQSTGTSQQQITVPDFQKRRILVPCNSVMTNFMSKIDPLFATIGQNKIEMKMLLQLQNSFLAAISQQIVN